MQSERDTLPTGSLPESRDSDERVTISTLPRSAEANSGARRARGDGVELPGRWMERLLALWTELPVAAGDRAVTLAVVDAVASLLDDHAVGACVVPLRTAARRR